LSNNSNNKSSIGFAYNKSTPAESSDPKDYEWFAIASSPEPLMVDSILPVGMIMMFSGDKIPDGWEMVNESDLNSSNLPKSGKKIIYIQKTR
jgi:hypothetical protein